VIDPQLTLLPQIEASGLLHMTGFFPSVPTQVNFDLAYAAVNGQWRLFGISVALGRTEPVAPSPPPPEAANAPTRAGARTGSQTRSRAQADAKAVTCFRQRR